MVKNYPDYLLLHMLLFLFDQLPAQKDMFAAGVKVEAKVQIMVRGTFVLIVVKKVIGRCTVKRVIETNVVLLVENVDTLLGNVKMAFSALWS